MTRRETEFGRKWAAVDAENRKIKAALNAKIEKLERISPDRGATSGEAQNARALKVTFEEKAAALRNPYDPPPLPPTVEELLALRKLRKPRKTARAHAPPDEVARLRAEVARLEAEVARLKAPRSKAGRKPIGDRPMTAAERMRRWRAK